MEWARLGLSPAESSPPIYRWMALMPHAPTGCCRLVNLILTQGKSGSRLGERRGAIPGQHMPGSFGPLFTHEELPSMHNS